MYFNIKFPLFRPSNSLIIIEHLSFFVFHRRVTDSSKNLGTYAFRLPKDNVKGIWISFEEPETAKQKATYVKQNNLGGIALMDLSLDDARGLCDSSKYPILKAVRNVL